jgi:hypothetical protein
MDRQRRVPDVRGARALAIWAASVEALNPKDGAELLEGRPGYIASGQKWLTLLPDLFACLLGHPFLTCTIKLRRQFVSSAWDKRSAARRLGLLLSIGDDQNFARAGDRVDGNFTENHAFWRWPHKILPGPTILSTLEWFGCHKPERRWLGLRRFWKRAVTPAKCAAARTLRESRLGAPGLS